MPTMSSLPLVAAPPSLVHRTSSPGLVTAAMVIVAIAALYFGREIFVPFALAVLLSFLLAPLVTRLQKWGTSRSSAGPIVSAGSRTASGSSTRRRCNNSWRRRSFAKTSSVGDFLRHAKTSVRNPKPEQKFFTEFPRFARVQAAPGPSRPRREGAPQKNARRTHCAGCCAFARDVHALRFDRSRWRVQHSRKTFHQRTTNLPLPQHSPGSMISPHMSTRLSARFSQTANNVRQLREPSNIL